jgi:protein disulfide-isomerase-like protein
MKQFKSMDNWIKYLLGVCVLLLLGSMFWPRRHSVGVKLMPVPGSSYYRAVFEGFSSDDKVKQAMSNGKPAFVAFVAPWCGYCKKLKPNWSQFERGYSGKNCNVLSVDCTQYKEIGKKHGVTGYPTIKYLPNGLSNPDGAVDYKGDRAPAAFNSFISQYH